MKHLKIFNTHNNYNNFILDENNTPNVSICNMEEHVHYNKKIECLQRYLTFTALEPGTFTVTINCNTDNLNYLEYSLDNGNSWNRTDNIDGSAVIITTPTLQTGERVMWRGSGYRMCNIGSGQTPSAFSSTGRFNASGSIMSLLYVDNFDKETTEAAAFKALFKNCTTLVTPPELPATSINENSYNEMFKGCTSLTIAPDIPATSVAYAGCQAMFAGCSSMTTTPSELKALNPLANAYYFMFENCTSITDMPKIMATEFKNNVCYGMLKGCTSLTKVYKLYVPRILENSCREMFMNCTSLMNVPSDMISSVIKIDGSGCNAMFSGCSKLETSPEINATTLAYGSLYGMFKNCTSLTSTPSELPATSLASACYREMFMGCTSITEAPILPATTLISQCYQQMFDGCTLLTKIKMMATDVSASYCLSNWVRNVASDGIFIKNIDAAWTTTGSSGIPSGWTVQTAAS